GGHAPCEVTAVPAGEVPEGRRTDPQTQGMIVGTKASRATGPTPAVRRTSPLGRAPGPASIDQTPDHSSEPYAFVPYLGTSRNSLTCLGRNTLPHVPPRAIRSTRIARCARNSVLLPEFPIPRKAGTRPRDRRLPRPISPMASLSASRREAKLLV